jgi:hypothetical protein
LSPLSEERLLEVSYGLALWLPRCCRAMEKTAGRRDALHDGAVVGCAAGARGGEDMSSSQRKKDGVEEDDATTLVHRGGRRA